MNKKKALVLCILSFSFSLIASAGDVESQQIVNKLASKYIVTKNKISKSEQFTRKVKNTLNQINRQMRIIRQKRNKLNSEMEGTKIKIVSLNKKVSELEKSISGRKNQIRKQIRALYKFSGLSKIGFMISSGSIQEFEKNMKYLKLYSDSDYNKIIEYSADIEDLNSSKKSLKDGIKKLEIVSKSLDNQNIELNKKIKSKKVLLGHLRKQRNKYFELLTTIKSKKEKLALSDKIDDLNEIFGTDFFEKRGQLEKPVPGSFIGKFGISVDKKYRNKIRNSGVFIKSYKNIPVRNVHPGKVSFVGPMQGLGLVIIIEHGDHYYTLYGNNKKVFVKQGDKLNIKHKIGSVGFSPYYNKYGSYFEVRYFSEPMNPIKWFSKLGNYSQLQEF